MKILIMVLSFNEAPFSDFMKMQQETWDKQLHPDIGVVYYYGGGYQEIYHREDHLSLELGVACSDEYEMMHWKFKLALGGIRYRDYDLIFRTNSCSYIVKDRLLEVAKTLPPTKCYAGYQNGSYISGAGIFFSPDVLDILKAELTPNPHGAEDVLMGHMLNGRIPMIAENSRIDADVNGVDNFNSYHFRFKTSNDPADRYRDVNNMVELHNKLTAQ